MQRIQRASANAALREAIVKRRLADASDRRLAACAVYRPAATASAAAATASAAAASATATAATPGFAFAAAATAAAVSSASAAAAASSAAAAPAAVPWPAAKFRRKLLPVSYVIDLASDAEGPAETLLDISDSDA